MERIEPIEGITISPPYWLKKKIIWGFLLPSNRLDQVIQEIFIRVLHSKLGKPIKAEHVMTDDVKHYNAWTEIMKTACS